jgi:hypothetical protein
MPHAIFIRFRVLVGIAAHRTALILIFEKNKTRKLAKLGKNTATRQENLALLLPNTSSGHVARKEECVLPLSILECQMRPPVFCTSLW